jgi:hypothetical protein
MVYHEEGNDSVGTKFVGSIGNALVFVAIVTLTTVLFVVLYKYRCMKVGKVETVCVASHLVLARSCTGG